MLQATSQDSTNVVRLPGKSKRTRKAPRPLIALGRQRKVGFAMLASALLLSVLSTKHQIAGLVEMTNDPYTCILAVVIETGYILLEVAKLTVFGKAEIAVRQTLMIMLTGLLALSATMNAYAFSLSAAEAHQMVAIGFGILIPFLVFGFARIAGPMVLARR